jgi:hypothetical protein
MSPVSFRLLALAVAALAVPAIAYADGLQAGLWRMQNYPVVGGVAGPAQEATRCLTPADVADLDKTFTPTGQTINSECRMVEHELTPQRLKWHLQCRGQLDMDLTGDYSFDTPEHYTATVTTSASLAGRLMQSGRIAVEAQRTGECQ